MCGRARSSYTARQIIQIARVPENTQHECRVRENIAPGQPCSVIVYSADNETHRDVTRMTWGLIPHFFPKTDKPDHFFMFNCRVETITEKRSFKQLLASGKRCVVIMSGFYEWAVEAGEKQPYYIYKQDESPMLFAALYDEFHDATGGELVTFAILTCPAGKAMKRLHHRQPIYLLEEEVDRWLDPNASVLELLNSWMKPEIYEAMCSNLSMHPVTPKMNSLSYQAEDCSTLIQKNKISNFFKVSSPKQQTDPSSPYSKESKERVLACASTSASGVVKDEPSASEKQEFHCTRKMIDFTEKNSDEVRKEQPGVVEIVDTLDETPDDAEISIEAVRCPICSKDLTQLSGSDRNLHASSCNGEADSSAPVPNDQGMRLLRPLESLDVKPLASDAKLKSKVTSSKDGKKTKSASSEDSKFARKEKTGGTFESSSDSVGSRVASTTSSASSSVKRKPAGSSSVSGPSTPAKKVKPTNSVSTPTITSFFKKSS